MAKKVRLSQEITYLFLALFFVSFIAIAFDNHDDMEDSSSCPICLAELALNGTQNSIIVEFHPAVSYYHAVEQPRGITMPVSLSFENRAPPETHQS